MINALFDNTRRKEIQGAILAGKPIPFKAREPMASTLNADGQRVRFEGTLLLGTGQQIGGYEFVYNGPADAGGIAMGIRSGDAPGLTTTLPVGKQSAVDFPADGQRVRITPREAGRPSAYVEIELEQMYAECD